MSNDPMSRAKRQMEEALKEALAEGDYKNARRIARDYCQPRSSTVEKINAVFCFANAIVEAALANPTAESISIEWYSEYNDEGGYDWNCDVNVHDANRTETHTHGLEEDFDILEAGISQHFAFNMPTEEAADLKTVVKRILEEVGTAATAEFFGEQGAPAPAPPNIEVQLAPLDINDFLTGNEEAMRFVDFETAQNGTARTAQTSNFTYDTIARHAIRAWRPENTVRYSDRVEDLNYRLRQFLDGDATSEQVLNQPAADGNTTTARIPNGTLTNTDE